MPKWTDVTIRNFKAPSVGQVDKPDPSLPGLFLRVTAKGTKSWCLFYRIDGPDGNRVQRRMTLGRYHPDGGMSLSEAREAANAAQKLVRLGVDPMEERKRQKHARPARMPLTFDMAAEQFIVEYARPRRRAWKETARLLGLQMDPKSTGPQDKRTFVQTGNGALKHFKDWLVDDITRPDIRDMLKPMERTPYQRNRTLAATRKMLNWLVSQDLLASSPAVGIEMLPELVRDRTLTSDEIKALWIACEAEGNPFGPLHQLLLLTGQRLGEIAGIRWSEIDLDAGLWTLSAKRTKAARMHIVPLSTQAVELLKGVPKIEGIDHVLTSGRRGDQPLSGFSKPKSEIDTKMADAMKVRAVVPWRVHDLRRTCATGMAARGTSGFIVSQVLNHAPQGITAQVYNQFDYLDEKREALQRWADAVAAMVRNEPAEIVEMWSAV